MELLTHLRRAHGREEDAAAAPRKITLKRKAQQEIKVASTQGRARTVNVEVRAKKTYLNRTVLEEEQRQRQEEVDRVRQAEETSAPRGGTARGRAARRRASRARAARGRGAQAASTTRRGCAPRPRKPRQAEHARARPARARASPTASARAAEPRAARPRRRRVRAPGARPRTARARATKYGRQELHVAGDASARFKKKQMRAASRRHVPVSVDPAAASSRSRRRRSSATCSCPRRSRSASWRNRMAVKANEVIKTMMKMGVMATINQPIDQDTAQLVVEEFGHTAVRLKEDELEDQTQGAGSASSRRCRAPPVVTIMGHVDHGKTSLLDYIRRAKVAAGEAGGITQHIGAYQVETPKGLITFLDTPGHAAFTAMRARGAQVTDIVVLVVAADDGVMPQTIEAIQHARAANVPIVVAVNKIDKHGADPDRVRNELVQAGRHPRGVGRRHDVRQRLGPHRRRASTSCSSRILLQAEVLDLKAPPRRPRRRAWCSSRASRRAAAPWPPCSSSAARSRRATRSSPARSSAACARCSTRRASRCSRGRPVACRSRCSACRTPRTPATTCWRSKASARRAKSRSYRQGKYPRRPARERGEEVRGRVLADGRGGRAQNIQLIVKADVQGSAEALRDALSKLATDEVAVKVIASGVGGITESDVTLAAASKARIIGFNVRADGAARAAIKDNGVEVRYYSIIYEAIDDVKQAVSGMLKPEIKEQIVGLAEVREVFRSSKFGTVAGCLVVEGVIKRGNPMRVLRDNVVIYQGELDSLRRFKDDVSEVRAGTECGIGVRELQRHPRRRPDRVLRPGRGRAQRVTVAPCRVKSRGRVASPSRCSARWPSCCGARSATRASKPVTITHVKMSPDLSHAWVQFELLTGDAHDPAAAGDPRRGGGLPARPARPRAAAAHRAAHPFPARRGTRARPAARRPDHAGRARGRRAPPAALTSRRRRRIEVTAPPTGASAGERPRWRDLDGIVLLDKPHGPRFDARLQRVRRLLRAAKAGHAGTLDPMATGMLPLCFGQATKACGQLLGSAKAYRARLRARRGDRHRRCRRRAVIALGAGAGARPRPCSERCWPALVGRARPGAADVLGPEARRPAAVRAGAARRGGRARAAPRSRSTALRAAGLRRDGGSSSRWCCSKGTYVRVLGEEIAAALGTVGHLSVRCAGCGSSRSRPGAMVHAGGDRGLGRASVPARPAAGLAAAGRCRFRGAAALRPRRALEPAPAAGPRAAADRRASARDRRWPAPTTRRAGSWAWSSRRPGGGLRVARLFVPGAAGADAETA